MEEVEILPRDAYLHTVNIARAPCTLQWWFTTKRKNIDFGLFQRRGTEDAGSAAGSLHEDSGSSTIGRQRGLGHFKLQDRGVTELMALKHYESSKSTIKGTWHVSAPGSYVLYFDNSFSKNTSKRVSFCVAVKEEAREERRDDFSGWLLKKKRKRMQGWARRWFAIQDAWLVYSTTEGGVPRAKIDVAGAVVSASKEDRGITIDADEGFFQLRAQTQAEYDAWVRALRRAKDAGGEAHSAGATLQSDATQQQQPVYRAPSNVAKAHTEFAESVDKLSQLLGAIGDAALRDRALEYLQAASASEGALHSLVGSGSMHSAVSEMSFPVALTASRASWHSESDVFYDTNDVLELVGASVQHSPRSEEVRDDAASDDEDGFSDRGSREGTESSGRSSRLRQDLIRDPDFVEALARTSIQVGTTPEQAGEAAGEASDPGTDPRASATIDGMRRTLAGYEPRTRLPAETCAANVSLISILRKNVGKDLSSIAMPLVMNEPINALQSLCEELMYQRLLVLAAEQADSLDRLMHVAAFAISALSSKKPRAERKPFNPLLGETYEMVEATMGFRFVAEKVSHHPPVMACYADAPAYRFWQDSSGKSKFWGKSMEIIQTSNVHVELPAHGDHFTWAKPSALVRGLIAGPRTVDFTGEMTIVNHATGDRCAVAFKEGGLFSSSADEVECRLFRQGSTTCERVLRGCWSSHLRHERGPGHHADTLWTAAAQPADAEKYYSFNYFTMRLNDLPKQLRPLLPDTDTRLRPDQRAYEEGRVEEAEGLKTELEEAQRARKRRRDEAGESWAAKWFELRDDAHSPDGASWQYRGGYWAARTKHEFPPTDQLW
ncbi:Oxysterol-binding protein 3 [Coemansia interrupta]|uniref:Oxysterol-binding protein 3 n=1 Tax=Coemansia interrupta TaxID=1126814 RepID=A0A9W8H7B0_9FUNG|nr:Oxysterol-binding protein 3 [Coemansia interrupta]